MSNTIDDSTAKMVVTEIKSGGYQGRVEETTTNIMAGACL
jgi:hypothetical protein